MDAGSTASISQNMARLDGDSTRKARKSHEFGKTCRAERLMHIIPLYPTVCLT